ncbi:hypothetical Protein YC6258_05437 [Gynuella sunshinyii YC6258]|uniref:Uncharacterized protein n=1 Tax=Gynuella sunshinyii YC6258 TaxID=1445510 RepID=A0A0C5VS33_9GAMM|nr:hypothetical Protein YC6258_05437 [Gynuella sunshinyii YC6258]
MDIDINFIVKIYPASQTLSCQNTMRSSSLMAAFGMGITATFLNGQKQNENSGKIKL